MCFTTVVIMYQTCNQCGQRYAITLSECPHCGDISTKQTLTKRTSMGDFTSERVSNNHKEDCKLSSLPKTMINYSYDNMMPLFPENTFNGPSLTNSIGGSQGVNAFSPNGFGGGNPYGGNPYVHNPYIPPINNNPFGRDPFACPMQTPSYYPVKYDIHEHSTVYDKRVYSSIMDAVRDPNTQIGERVTTRSGRSYIIREKGPQGYAEPI